MGSPIITSPDSLDNAIPSTLLCEYETSKSETATLRMHVSRQVINIIETGHSVSENQSMRITDATKEITAGNISREIKYPFLPIKKHYLPVLYCNISQYYKQDG